jgi:hypothetical protein
LNGKSKEMINQYYGELKILSLAFNPCPALFQKVTITTAIGTSNHYGRLFST